MAKVQKQDDCWLWTGSKLPDHYGRMWDGTKVRYVTHLAWELEHNEPFPAGMLACHHCDNPSCVNPEHLFIGTHLDNLNDARRKGRTKEFKPFCPQGHQLSGENLYVNKKTGWRYCKACMAQRCRQYQARRKASA